MEKLEKNTKTRDVNNDISNDIFNDLAKTIQQKL